MADSRVPEELSYLEVLLFDTASQNLSISLLDELTAHIRTLCFSSEKLLHYDLSLSLSLSLSPLTNSTLLSFRDTDKVTTENRARIFVHCSMGISRSAAVVLAYLMRYHVCICGGANDAM